MKYEIRIIFVFCINKGINFGLCIIYLDMLDMIWVLFIFKCKIKEIFKVI